MHETRRGGDRRPPWSCSAMGLPWPRRSCSRRATPARCPRAGSAGARGPLDPARTSRPTRPTPLVLQLDGETQRISSGELDAYRAELESPWTGVAAITSAEPEAVGPGVVRMDLVPRALAATTPRRRSHLVQRGARGRPAPLPAGWVASRPRRWTRRQSVADHIPLARFGAGTHHRACSCSSMTRSVLLPIKALVMNVLSLTAASGLRGALSSRRTTCSGLFSFESQGGHPDRDRRLDLCRRASASRPTTACSRSSRIKELREPRALEQRGGRDRARANRADDHVCRAPLRGRDGCDLVTAELIGVQDDGIRRRGGGADRCERSSGRSW